MNHQPFPLEGESVVEIPTYLIECERLLHICVNAVNVYLLDVLSWRSRDGAVEPNLWIHRCEWQAGDLPKGHPDRVVQQVRDQTYQQKC